MIDMTQIMRSLAQLLRVRKVAATVFVFLCFLWICTFANIIRLQTNYFEQHKIKIPNADDEIVITGSIRTSDLKGSADKFAAMVSEQTPHDKIKLLNLDLLKLDEDEGLAIDIFRKSELKNDVSDTCAIPIDPKFPHCSGKVMWMRSQWKSDKCYSENGVNGSDCSFLQYLSEVEHWCPLLPGRGGSAMNKTSVFQNNEKAELRFDVEPLMNLLQDPIPSHKNYDWMRIRIRRMWKSWINAAKTLERIQNMKNRKRKKIFIHLGVLTLKFGESAFTGGPLGELVQWSDLIATLYILGHDLSISSELTQLVRYIRDMSHGNSSCQDTLSLPLDIVFMDIIGVKQFQRANKNGFPKFRCLLRVVDSFGTEPQFNYEPYAKKHKYNSQWGKHNLWPKQFYNMFPHTPDNSFLGFVVERANDTSQMRHIARRNQALAYGKNEYMWKGKEAFLDVVKEFVEIHGTVAMQQNGRKPDTIPRYVKNHGILVGDDLTVLLRQSKLFLGFGFPYEGPAPLEAIANGAIFINPKFDPPHGSQNTPFFKNKPTHRQLSSQHPYAEQFIGEPYVYTVNITDPIAVRKALEIGLNATEGTPYLPYEFTEEGMLQRVNSLINHQDFCNVHQPIWPPKKDMSIFLSPEGLSCKDACSKIGKICEPSYFKYVNNEKQLAQLGIYCNRTDHRADLPFPAIDKTSTVCTLQSQELLFSCVGSSPSHKRFCPCRNFRAGQTALCEHCL